MATDFVIADGFTVDHECLKQNTKDNLYHEINNRNPNQDQEGIRLTAPSDFRPSTS
jgi:hypothetical protein